MKHPKLSTHVFDSLASLGAGIRLAQIEAEATAIRAVFPGLSPAPARSPSGKPKRVFSAAAKRRMSAGMRAFWKRRKAAAVAKAKGK